MATVAVATDSTHYLPRSLADAQGVHQVSLYVGWKGEPARELDMDGFDAFYERLRVDPELPSTSQPSIGDFLAVWEPLLDAGHDIVSIHLAGGISGTCEAARQAHQLLGERGLGERVEVIDGETACGGTGLLVLAACAAAHAASTSRPVPPHAVSPSITSTRAPRPRSPSSSCAWRAASHVPEMPPARWIETTSWPASISGSHTARKSPIDGCEVLGSSGSTRRRS